MLKTQDSQTSIPPVESPGAAGLSTGGMGGGSGGGGARDLGGARELRRHPKAWRGGAWEEPEHQCRRLHIATWVSLGAKSVRD